MRCNQIRMVTITHASTKKGAISIPEGCCELCTIVDTVSAIGSIILTFMV